MAQQLAALGPAGTERESKRNILEAVKETAKHLGNRPAACRMYYIHPAVFESYVEKTIFAFMPNVPKEMSTAQAVSAPVGKLRPSEIAVLRLDESYMRARHAKAS